jgi:putative transcriptional regulator
MDDDTATPPEEGYLTGQLLIAMPTMMDQRFERAVIYMCAHTADGAMGLVINHEIESVTFPDLLEQLHIEPGGISGDEIRVMFGGPVETGRGFVLHSADYVQDTTLLVNQEIGLTATKEILRDIATGAGPRRSLLALGYAGWGPGQLDAEIQANGWLHAPADEAILFDQKIAAKWDQALARIGINSMSLSGDAGHA